MSNSKIFKLILLTVVIAIAICAINYYMPKVTIERDVSNVNHPVLIKYTNYPHHSNPYSDNENCTISKVDSGYEISSSFPGVVTVYNKLGPITTKKDIIFEQPDIQLTKDIINISDSTILTVSGISGLIELQDTGSFVVEQINTNQFTLYPTKPGKQELLLWINGEQFSVDIMVDNPSVTVLDAREKETAEIIVSGVSTHYELETSNDAMGIIEENTLHCLSSGELNIILTANGQQFTYPVDIKKHIHQWSNWETIPPECEKDGYDIKTCFCGEEEKKNFTEALEHQWEHISEESTCLATGYERDVCSICGSINNEIVIEKKEHVSGDWVIIEDVKSPVINGAKAIYCKKCDSELDVQPYTYQEKVQKQKAKRWMYGRLVIPDVGVDVAVIKVFSQETTDAQDSAAYFDWNGAWLIADHWNQGFDAIKQCQPGDICYIVTGDDIEEYKCLRMDYGHNTGFDLTENDWSTSVTGQYPGKIIMYTCNNGWQNIAFVVWERIN